MESKTFEQYMTGNARDELNRVSLRDTGAIRCYFDRDLVYIYRTERENWRRHYQMTPASRKRVMSLMFDRYWPDRRTASAENHWCGDWHTVFSD